MGTGVREGCILASAVDDLHLHHLYRAMAWLGEELAEDQQEGAMLFAPRRLKNVLEEDLFARRRDLRSPLDPVFMDTTSLYFDGAASPRAIGPISTPMILAALLDGDGRPAGAECVPETPPTSAA